MNRTHQQRLLCLCLHLDDEAVLAARDAFKVSATPEERSENEHQFYMLGWIREMEIAGVRLRSDPDRVRQLESFTEHADRSQIEWGIRARDMDWTPKDVYDKAVDLFKRAYSLNIPAKVSYAIVAAGIHRQGAVRPYDLPLCHLIARHRNAQDEAAAPLRFRYIDPAAVMLKLDELLQRPPPLQH